ncbi:hypothetical protein [Streptacidiphilus cavernicola]|uniref:Uncharacterized protein n=1 Tax=Streptacidiphilus cavernicola TaxID=3342716 RepID=A0ABV6VXT9_9ACTN
MPDDPETLNTTSEHCPCGHGHPDLYQCIGGWIYGPCDHEDCGGVCETVAECKGLPGCCDIRADKS